MEDMSLLEFGRLLVVALAIGMLPGVVFMLLVCLL